MSDYPSEAALTAIREWPLDDPAGWFAFIRSIWWSADWGWTTEEKASKTLHNVSTGGWSGNEEIIDAMRESVLWGMTWRIHSVGGHYEFGVMHAAAKDQP